MCDAVAMHLASPCATSAPTPSADRAFRKTLTKSVDAAPVSEFPRAKRTAAAQLDVAAKQPEALTAARAECA
eukprot:6189803-Pleurochrysis_carterae.AAC.1